MASIGEVSLRGDRVSWNDGMFIQPGEKLEKCDFGKQCPAFCKMWDLLGPGMEPASPATAAGFLTSGPAGTSPRPGFTRRIRPGCQEAREEKSF